MATEDELHHLASLWATLWIPASDSATAVSREEGELLFRLVRSAGATRTLEVGFAYGASAAYIMMATQRDHYAIDPYQAKFGDVGIQNIGQLGWSDRLHLLAEPSHVALPSLLRLGTVIDFAFIDGDHKYDTTFVDFYYLDLMLEAGGHVLFHDVWMPSIQNILAWIRTNKSNYESVPTSVGNMALVRKLGHDGRSWDHFHEFCRRLGGWHARARALWFRLQRRTTAAADR
jgi:predicted O-methyltransferase YrrM